MSPESFPAYVYCKFSSLSVFPKNKKPWNFIKASKSQKPDSSFFPLDQFCDTPGVRVSVTENLKLRGENAPC